MRTELIPLTSYTVSSNPIELDDYNSNSYAVYCATNSKNKVFLCYKPDEKRGPDPRCDYLLVCNGDGSVRFIELKGVNYSPTTVNCCKSVWAHAFHQLVETYITYEELIDAKKDVVSMILCTSVSNDRGKQRGSTRYKQYPYYKKILMRGITPRVLYSDEIDEV